MTDLLAEYEGTVMPSYYKPSGAGGQERSKGPILRVGRVVQAYYPGLPGNSSGKWIEYDVSVDEGSEHNPVTRYTIPRCVVLSAFGGADDYSTFTLKKDDKDPNAQVEWGSGSRVLVLLVNGSSFGGVIIGGVQHSKRQKADSLLDGHSAKMVFNGVEFSVSDSGELTVSFNGATGSQLPSLPVLPGSTGSAFRLKADGSISLSGPSETQSVKISNIGQSVEISTGIGGFKIGSATDQFVKGTTYRTAEAVSNVSVAAAMTANAAAMTALAAFLASPPILNLASQDPSGTTAVLVSTATGATAAAATASTAAATAITTFEAGALAYLSLRSKTD